MENTGFKTNEEGVVKGGCAGLSAICGNSRRIESLMTDVVR